MMDRICNFTNISEDLLQICDAGDPTFPGHPQIFNFTNTTFLDLVDCTWDSLNKSSQIAVFFNDSIGWATTKLIFKNYYTNKITCMYR
jgi:hypothetical protein